MAYIKSGIQITHKLPNFPWFQEHTEVFLTSWERDNFLQILKISHLESQYSTLVCLYVCVTETAVKPRLLKVQIFSWEAQKITRISDSLLLPERYHSYALVVRSEGMCPSHHWSSQELLVKQVTYILMIHGRDPGKTEEVVNRWGEVPLSFSNSSCPYST